MDIRKLIEEYLTQAKLMQVATVKDQKPWVATVWYVHDDDLNIYFISKKSRRHSLELGSNPHVAGAIVYPHHKGSGEKVRGIQFEGEALPALGEDLVKARELYLSKYEMAKDIPLHKLEAPKFIATFYKIIPSEIILFDEVNFPDSPRRKFVI